MISSLQPYLVLGLTGPWVETLLAVAALAGMGYAWRWHTRPAPGDGQPEETKPERADVPAAPPAKPEPEVSSPSSSSNLLTRDRIVLKFVSVPPSQRSATNGMFTRFACCRTW